MSTPVTRRSFLSTSAAAGVAGLTMNTMLRDARAADANDRLTVALIGCGGMGRRKLQNFLDAGGVDLVALCDVDPNQMANVLANPNIKAKIGDSKVKTTSDYREIAGMKGLDTVIVATPDHWHAATTIECLKGGKHVYCEKPAAHNIREARAMLEAARKYKNLVLQIGTHQRSAKHMQEAREFVRSGKLGQITMTNTYTYGNEYPIGMQPKSDPMPQGLDYDRWLGPAPKRDFDWHRFHGTWRWFFDYGCGMVGDWNVHLQDIIMWTMDALTPISVTTLGGKLALKDDRDTPDTMQAIYEFPNFVQTYTMRKASGKPWWHGGYGMDFHGTNGMLHMNRDGWEIIPDAKDYTSGDEEAKKPRVEPFKYEGGPGLALDRIAAEEHAKDFLKAVREKTEPLASMEKHYPIVVACHLANVSLKVGRQIFWDAKKELCFHDRSLTSPDEEANKLLGREYRSGYELPTI